MRSIPEPEYLLLTLEKITLIFSSKEELGLATN